MSSPLSLERVLQVHTLYREPGGEDRVVEAERRLLSGAGVEVRQVLFDNDDLRERRSLSGDLQLAAGAIWSRAARKKVAAEISAFRPQVVHVHNTFAAASPAVYSPAFDAGIPVVQTLHNYRLICPAATLFRDGHACTDCVGRHVPWPAVQHSCVRASRSQSAVAALTHTFHRVRRTYAREVSAYLALTEFQRSLLIEGGLPADRVRVLPNFLEPDPGVRVGRREGLLYVGRLSEEKGIATLLAAATAMPGVIRIGGDGPLAPAVRQAAERGAVQYLGRLGPVAVTVELGRAVALVLPSVWYEGLPMVLLEAFAVGTPVIASRIGSLSELIEEGRTGLFMTAGDPGDCRQRMQWALDHGGEMGVMGSNARHAYEARYRGAEHLDALLEVFVAARVRGPRQ